MSFWRKLERKVFSIFSVSALAMAIGVASKVCFYEWGQPKQPAALDKYCK
jgi:hypothetical protein